MSPSEISRYEAIGKLVRSGAISTTPKEEEPRWSRVILPIAFLAFVLVSVFLNAAQVEVSEDVPAPVYLDGAK